MRFICSLILLASLLLPLSEAHADAPPLADDSPTSAALAILSDETLSPEERRAQLQAIVNHNPECADCWTAYGEAVEAIGDRQLALRCYEKAVEIDPEAYSPWFRIGILAKRGVPEPDLRRAESAFRRALTAGAPRARTLNELAVTMALQNRLSDAVDAWKSAIEDDPGWGDLYSNIMIAVRRTGDEGLGRAYIDKAIEAERFDPSAVLAFGDFLVERRKPAEAVDIYNRALERHPDQVRIRYQRALALEAAGQRDEARAAYQQIAGMSPEDRRIAELVQAAEFDLFRLDHPADEKRFQEARRLVFDQDTTGRNLSRNLERAIRQLDPIVEKHPAFWNSLFVRGVAHRRLDQREEARADFERVRAIRPNEPNTIMQLALMERDDFRFAEAAELAEDALELAPRDPTFVINGGLIMIEAGRCDRAWELYRIAVRMVGEENSFVLREELDIRCRENRP